MRKLTHKQEQVLEIISSSDHPLSAHQIYFCLQKESLSLATVYRTLKALVANHQVDVFPMVLGSGGVLWYYFQFQHPHFYLLYCMTCQRVTQDRDSTFQKLKTYVEEKYKFQVHSHVLCYHGVCKDCSSTT